MAASPFTARLKLYLIMDELMARGRLKSWSDQVQLPRFEMFPFQRQRREKHKNQQYQHVSAVFVKKIIEMTRSIQYFSHLLSQLLGPWVGPTARGHAMPQEVPAAPSADARRWLKAREPSRRPKRRAPTSGCTGPESPDLRQRILNQFL